MEVRWARLTSSCLRASPTSSTNKDCSLNKERRHRHFFSDYYLLLQMADPPMLTLIFLAAIFLSYPYLPTPYLLWYTPLASLSALLIACLLCFLRPPPHATDRLPPGPPRWPIFGNLLQLGHLPHRDLSSLCQRYGPLVYLRLGNVHAITTDDPSIIREILLQQDEVFASRPRTLAAVHLAYGCGDVALAPLGPRWKRMRRICMEHLLTTKRLESFARHRADEAMHLVRYVHSKCRDGKGETINLREVLGAFSMNNVTRMLLGKQYFGAETAGPQEAMEFMDITHQLFWLLGVIYLGDYLPLWRWIDPYGCERKMREVEKRVDDFHTRIIREHRKAREEGGGGRRSSREGGRRGEEEEEGDMDFVDVLLSLPGEDGKEHLDDVDIKALIQVFLSFFFPGRTYK